MQIFYYSFFVILLLLSNGLIAQNDWEAEGLKGKIKSISLTVYRSTKKSGELKLLGKSAEQLLNYNQEGYLLDSKQRYHTRTYGTGPWRSTDYQLDENNQCTQQFFFKEGEKIQRVDYSYKDNQVQKTAYFDEKDLLIVEVFFEKDKNGLTTEKLVMNADSSIRSKTSSTYTKKGKILTQIEWEDGAFRYSNSYSYQKKIVKKSSLDEAGSLIDYEIQTLDNKGRLVNLSEYDKDGNLTKKRIHEYDKKGNENLTRIFAADGAEEKYNYMRYEYEYDKKKNWIRKVEYLHNGNSLDVSVREITYY